MTPAVVDACRPSLERRRVHPDRPDPSPPEIGTDQVGQLPVRPLFEHGYLLAGLCERCRIDRTRGTRANDRDIDFLVCGHDHHLLVGAICAMYGMPSAA